MSNEAAAPMSGDLRRVGWEVWHHDSANVVGFFRTKREAVEMAKDYPELDVLRVVNDGTRSTEVRVVFGPNKS